ncbi:Hemin uptake protein HemP [Pararobbsia alpina]|jgi:hemin uptake protein HemP|uniref:hemin uptake protein HemP n=1 Tax=Pararobbsia alpina TaxID=621374 RepID=UPI0039A6CD58
MNLSNPISRPKLKLRSAVTGGDTGGAPATKSTYAVNSATLMQGKNTLDINHQGMSYRLRVTRNGGLILTKD